MFGPVWVTVRFAGASGAVEKNYFRSLQHDSAVAYSSS